MHICTCALCMWWGIALIFDNHLKCINWYLFCQMGIYLVANVTYSEYMEYNKKELIIIS